MKRESIIAMVGVLFWFVIGVVPALASQTDGTINAGSNYAWGENIGWINFGAVNGNIHITDTALSGFAWSQNYGWINLSPTNGGVTNTSGGILGGNAWSSTLGWIPFSGVTIDTSGKLTGRAGTAGSTAGRINFDCSNCSVITDWRPASVRTSSSTLPSTTSSSSNNSNASATPTPASFLNNLTNTFSPNNGSKSTSENPSQLFDIALIIDQPLIDNSSKLAARVTFTNFGTKDTPVEMEFVVLDQAGKESYKTTGKTVIQTEGVYNQAFKNLKIPDGKFTLLLTTVYNVNVKDQFRQPFEVRSQKNILNFLWGWGLLIIPLLFLLLIILWKKRFQAKKKI